MAGAGEYDARLEWRRKAAGAKDTFGERPQTAAPVLTSYDVLGHLWAAVEGLSAGEESRLDAKRQVTRATVRVRNWPAVRPRDELYDPEWDQVWRVVSVRRGDNELVADVECYG